MNLTPLLEREKESVEYSELFKANSVFPLEVWHMLFPGSIGFIQTKMEQLQLPVWLCLPRSSITQDSDALG